MKKIPASTYISLLDAEEHAKYLNREETDKGDHWTYIAVKDPSGQTTKATVRVYDDENYYIGSL